jgi:hypothetical protein
MPARRHRDVRMVTGSRSGVTLQNRSSALQDRMTVSISSSCRSRQAHNPDEGDQGQISGNPRARCQPRCRRALQIALRIGLERAATGASPGWPPAVRFIAFMGSGDLDQWNSHPDGHPWRPRCSQPGAKVASTRRTDRPSRPRNSDGRTQHNSRPSAAANDATSRSRTSGGA